MLKARVRFLTRNDICVPYEANFTLNLPVGATLIPRSRVQPKNGGQSAVSGAQAPLSINRRKSPAARPQRYWFASPVPMH